MGDLQHDFGGRIEQLTHGLAGLAGRQNGDANEDREEDDRQHIPIRKRGDRIGRDHVQQAIDDRGRVGRDRHGDDIAKISADARPENRPERQTDDIGEQGGDEIEGNRLQAQRAQFGRLAHRNHAGNQRGEDQRHDQHLDQSDKGSADGIYPGGYPGGRRVLAHDLRCRQAEGDACDQSDQNALPEFD